MKKDRDDLFNKIEEILTKNEDACKGYEKAADRTKSHEMAFYFREKSAKRKQFNAKLRNQLKSDSPDYGNRGSFGGSLNRGWMDLQNLSANSDESMLKASLKGDKAAIDGYNDVIEYDSLPPVLKSILIYQRDEIQRDISKQGSMESFH